MKQPKLVLSLGLGIALALTACNSGDKEYQRPYPAGFPSPVPTAPDPTTYCTASQLAGYASFGVDNYATDPTPIDGSLNLRLQQSAAACLLRRSQSISLLLGDQEIPFDYGESPWKEDLIVDGTETNQGVFMTFVWENWCAEAAPSSYTIRLRLDGDLVDAPITNALDGPPKGLPECIDSGRSTTVRVDRGFLGRVPEELNLKFCTARDLAMKQGFYTLDRDFGTSSDEPTVAVGDMWLEKARPPACIVDQWKSLEVLDGDGSELDIRVDSETGFFSEVQPQVVRGDRPTYVKFRWRNWCDALFQGPLTLRFELEDGAGVISWEVEAATDASGKVKAPRCTEPDEPSVLSIPKQF